MAGVETFTIWSSMKSSSRTLALFFSIMCKRQEGRGEAAPEEPEEDEPKGGVGEAGEGDVVHGEGDLVDDVDGRGRGDGGGGVVLRQTLWRGPRRGGVRRKRGKTCGRREWVWGNTERRGTRPTMTTRCKASRP